jgi:hypothetical protein
VSSTMGSEVSFNQTWPKTQLASALMSLPRTPQLNGSGRAARMLNAPASVVPKTFGSPAPLLEAQRGRCGSSNLLSRSSMPACMKTQGTSGPKRSVRGVPQHGGSSQRTSSR